MTNEQRVESAKREMRKGVLEFATMLVVSRGKAYASEIISELQAADLLVVEGTLYPLLSRLKSSGQLKYSWEESKSGPPRKYYELTAEGEEALARLKLAWKELDQSISSLIKK